MSEEKKTKYNNKPTKRRKAADIVFLVLTTILFETIALMFIMFPRTEMSELENRATKKFPEFTIESWLDGSFTAGISDWFTDSVPFRDNLMGYSKTIQELSGFSTGIKIYGNTKVVTDEEPVQTTAVQTTASTTAATTKPAKTTTENTPEETEPEETTAEQTTTTQGNQEIEAVENVNPDDAYNIYNNGIAVVGNRGLMLYGGSLSVGESYAKMINTYKETLPEMNVYSMVIPTSVEFYAPADVAALSGSQLKNINNVIANLSSDVKAVNVYTTLSEHKDEEIYLRTDHHWAAMGAYYAAQEFAKVAGVDFLDISDYEMQTVRNYVGSLYNYTSSPELKNNPEDFHYYTTDKVKITTTYYNYTYDSSGVTGIYDAFESGFFQKYGDGNGMAYCTHMGGDAKIVHVKTSTKNGRTLAILKDSYGNSLPQFLFGSFENIYVIDMRYFTYNFPDYAREHGFTDILFANNAFHAATASTVTMFSRFLTQKDWAGLTW